MIYHTAIDIGWILRASKEETTGMLRDAGTGMHMTSEEVKTHALMLKMRGFDVVPCCPHHDTQGYCLGHEEKEKQG